MNLRSFLGVLALIFFSVTAFAQPTVRITKLDANQGSIVDIDFTVDNYVRIIGFQFSVRWDSAVLQYEGVKNLNSVALESFNAGSHVEFRPENPGLLNFAYSNPNLKDTTLQNGTRMFTISFRVIGSVGSETEIDLTDLDPNELEFVNFQLDNVGVIQDKGRVRVVGMGGPGVRFIAGENEGAFGSRVCIGISANDFTDIGAFQYTLSWNPAFMRYDGLGNTNINIGPSNVEANNTNGTLTVSWNSANGETRPNGTVLFEVCFVITDILGCSDINFVSNPLAIEAATSDGNTISVFTQAGRICIDGVPDCIPNGLTVAIDRVTVTEGELFCVQYRVYNFTDIQSLQMSLQWDPNIIEYLSVRDFRLPNFNAGNFNDSQTNNGRLAFVWFGDDPVDLPNNSLLFEICFRALGGPGTSTDIVYNNSISIIEATNGSGEVVPIHECNGNVKIATVLPLSVSVVTTTNPTCEESNDGSISVQANGGTPPYTNYVWTKNGTSISGNTPNQNNIGSGMYRVIVTDTGGATASLTVTLTPQFNINVIGNTTNPKCVGDQNGSIVLNISGNTGGVTYLWSDNQSTNKDRSNLSAGAYTVTISYAGGANSACNIVRTFNLNAQPVQIQPNIDNTNKTITLNVSGGTSPYTYVWNPAGPNSPNLTGLVAGSYFVTVTDANGCTAVGGPYLIFDSDELVFDIETSDYNGYDISCFGKCDGFINITPLNGQAPFTYQWSVAGVTTAELNNRCVGVYRVTVTDASGKTATANIQLFTPERIRIDLIDFQASTGSDGSATVLASGGAGSFTYMWSDGTIGSSISDQAPEVVVVNVKDMNDCSVNLPVNFGEDGECYEHRKIITPNGDGLNDEFVISCLGGTNNRLEVFDRYGKMVYAASNYNNDWQGTGSNGSVLPDGAYFFVLKVTESNGKERIVRGALNLLYDLR